MKKTVYLDSTIPSYYFDKRKSLEFEIKITNRWWKEESDNYKVYISPETIAELENGNYPNKINILEFANKIVQLKPVEEVEKIAIFYIENHLMPDNIKGDAIHLAYASYYKIDFLLTWNCNHLANANKKQHIKIINGKLGLSTPEIITPLELFTEE